MRVCVDALDGADQSQPGIDYRGGGQRTDYAGRLNPRLPQECDKV